MNGGGELQRFSASSMDSTKKEFLTMTKCSKSSLRDEGFVLAHGSGSEAYRAWMAWWP